MDQGTFATIEVVSFDILNLAGKDSILVTVAH
jgi:hypothetical protein